MARSRVRLVRRVLIAGVGAALVAPPLVMHARAAVCNQPVISGVSPQFASPGPGTTITLTGSGLDGCSAGVSVGGVAEPVVDRTATSLRFTFSSAANGGVLVRLTDVVGGHNDSNADWVVVSMPSVAAQTVAPPVGQALSYPGSGLDLGGQRAAVAVAYTPRAGSCPGGPVMPTAMNDTQLVVPGLGQFCQAALTLRLAAYSRIGQAATFSASHAAAGSPVRVGGSGFGGGGSATVGGLAAPSQWSDTAVVVIVPDDAHSGSPVRAARSADGALIDAGAIGVDARVDSLVPTNAAVGDAVTIRGGGFGHAPGTVHLGAQSLPVQIWSPTQVVATVPAGARTGPLTLAPVDTAAGGGSPVLTVLPRLRGVTPEHAAPSALVEIDGTTLGIAAGTVSVGGKPAPVMLWGDRQILVTLPADLPAGPTTITVAVPGAAPLSIGFGVDPAPPASAPLPSLSTAALPIPPDPSGPVVATTPVPFVKPARPAGPVQLSLSPTTEQADPGQDVPVSVTLTAFGKPVAGAPVEFVMVIEPGKDASLSPPTVVTDEQGKAQAVLHLSATPGDHIVLARSGQYSDEIRVVGRGRATAASLAAGGGDAGATPFSQRLLIVGLLALCLVLFLSGFAIQLRAGARRPRPDSR
jgi:hypothetical protein